MIKMPLEFTLLNQDDVCIGDWYLDSSTKLVPGILPNNILSFQRDCPEPAPKPRAVHLGFVEPFEIYEVDSSGFKFQNAKGEPGGEQRFHEFMGGIIITRRAEQSKIYVGKDFMEVLHNIYLNRIDCR